MSELTLLQIRDIALKTTGQRTNPLWQQYRHGRLTASNFGRAIRILNRRSAGEIQRMKQDMYNPKSLDNIPAIRWGVKHEARAIDEYVSLTGAIVKPSGLWLYSNRVMGASPDGLVFADTHATAPIGIIEVKCPYSMRNVSVVWDTDWRDHLRYLDCNSELKKNHDYYHQIQGTMYAVGVQWCDFVIWTPSKLRIQRIPIDTAWGERYLGQLQDLYHDRLERVEDGPEGQSEAAEVGYQSGLEEDALFLWGDKQDLTSVLHPVGPSSMELRSQMEQAFAIHMSRWIFYWHSTSRSGSKWKTAVMVYWDRAVGNICERCIRRLFTSKWTKETCFDSRLLMSNVVSYMLSDEDCLWTSLLYDAEFARAVRTRVEVYEPSLMMREPACTCNPYVIPELFRMAPQSFAALEPVKEEQEIEEFPMLPKSQDPRALKFGKGRDEVDWYDVSLFLAQV